MNILIIAFFSLFIAANALAGCPGCCSSHGGISSSCDSSGRIYCKDGTVSPSCTCSKCGVSGAITPPAPTIYALIVTKTGAGAVTSSPLGINCGTDCSESFTANTAVTLTAKPNSGNTLSAWSGCSASGLTCAVKMTAAQSVGAIFSTSVAPAPFNACLDQFPNRKPPVISTAAGVRRDLCFDSFAVLHSGESKTAVYVVEKLNRARILDADEERTDRFYEEARLPAADRAKLSDYAGSGYDRGHLAPAADMPTPSAMTQSFSLANVVPQSSVMNSGVWADIEAGVRDYALSASGDVFVFTGPIYTKPTTTIGAGKVRIPKQLFKLVYDQKLNTAWAFIVTNADDAIMSPSITYSALKTAVGIDFLPGITPKK